MANQGINYTNRNFAQIRTDLVNMVRQYYPDTFGDFNDASIGMMLLELNAAVGDMLSTNTDRMFQETQIDYAQERKSILSMARTFGLKIPGKRPSVTLVDFSVRVPVFGDTFDVTYAPLIKGGSQVTGNGKVFETMDDIDFSSPFTTGGIQNRTIVPNYNSNGIIINYTLTKREMVINGYTRIIKRVVTAADVVPFLEILLPEDNVLSIDSIITLQGTSFTVDPAPSRFEDETVRWFEVDSLAEDKVFVEDPSRVSDNSGVSPGKWIFVTKKFIREYTDLGFTKITFGSGTQDISSLDDFGGNPQLVSQIGDFINNMSLGEIPTANTTMFIKYRIGGGSDSNLGPNTLTSVGLMNIDVNGANIAINNSVKNSLRVNNPLPVLGGKDQPTIDEIRNMVKYNFAAQNRAVTIKDYQTLVAQMPGRFGAPFRCGVYEAQNKINVAIIGLDSDGHLSNQATSTLIENIGSYLSNFRMMNDYVVANNGKIVNISFQIDLLIDKKFTQSQVISEVINAVTAYIDFNKFQMGDNIYFSTLVEQINGIGGVLNVLEIRVYNEIGKGKYSMNQVSQPYLDTETKQIDLNPNFTLFGEPNTMYECKFPATDIKVRVK